MKLATDVLTIQVKYQLVVFLQVYKFNYCKYTGSLSEFNSIPIQQFVFIRNKLFTIL